MTFSSLQIVRNGGLAQLIFSQPDRGNPIDQAFCSDFCDAANELSSDPTVRAVLMTAQGKAFSLGGDIRLFLQTIESLPKMILQWTADLHVGVARMQRMDAPIVAAVHGVCAGGMSAIVAGADIVIAERGARFVAAYAGIGYSPDAGSTIMYTRRMGIARTRKFLLLNEILGAEAALAVGLVDEVVEPGQLAARSEAIALQLASGPTKAFGEMRRLLSSVEDQPLEAQLELEAQALTRMAATDDAREGLKAFGEKRKPQFKGS
jgi:2-(1,2-epoxy-1,2-dihydrophenyl)acetyl-CoA isomerase